MPWQPPAFGRPREPQKPWAPAVGTTDKRLRGRAGQRARRAVLAEEPVCRICVEQHRVSASVVVDHIIPLSEGGTNDRGNQQGLCQPCHDTKSLAERVAAARRRRGR